MVDKSADELSMTASNSPTAKIPLSEIRTEITSLDSKLLQLFARRRELSLSVAMNKEASAKPIRDQVREQELLETLIAKGAEIGLDAHYVTRLFHLIIEDSLAVQRDYLQSRSNPQESISNVRSIAVLGGKGSYSYLAAGKHFSATENTYLGFSTFDKVLRSVEQGNADYGVIPIENTTSGGITEVYDLLLDSKLSIIGEEKYPIKHCLVAQHSTELSRLTKIHAHPEASRQCNKNLPRLTSAEVSLVSSTAEALQLAAEDTTGTIGAVASEKSAEAFGLKVLLTDVANLKENTTRFLVVSRRPQKVSNQVSCKTSIAISTGQKPGSLAEVLLVFRDADIPLSKLESRPIAGKPWEQMFYVDLAGNADDPKVAQALEEIAKLCRFLKVLGCYPTEDIDATKVSPQALSRTKISSFNGSLSGQSENTVQPAPSESASENQQSESNSKARNYRLAGRPHKPEDTVIEFKGVKIGGNDFAVIAGPHQVIGQDQIDAAARFGSDTGISVLRASCFKPQTSPYGFQGLGIEGVELLQAAGQKYHLPVMTEVTETESVRSIAEKVDLLQISARNMQNYSLLKAVGEVNRPVILKRGLMASIDELLNAAEYILAQGNMQVILCERGIRTFETATQTTLDLSAIPLIKEKSHLPIMVDPTYAVKNSAALFPLAKAAKAVGAHGLLLEFSLEQENRSSQTLSPDTVSQTVLAAEEFTQLIHSLYQ
ncbi:bifunctional 3-deoxy-7-phosphoheptulonate synthase/chorismate mutase [Aliikangiella sp. G2MR2-5]|uniref:bifunctional 3-deoxy-7-phosphoheptulonate synthase/chorismate mutase n=1 Tax=Aliikangiella sp. G2MR2-5 TaxID=2788943 RepID=UPI0018A8D9C4|nr:bifunctional 3-deoxy-7-phosphoheptulonate synthase/chorismate mutase [Aliikangiella sp. G2MR2-5]